MCTILRCTFIKWTYLAALENKISLAFFGETARSRCISILIRRICCHRIGITTTNEQSLLFHIFLDKTKNLHRLLDASINTTRLPPLTIGQCVGAYKYDILSWIELNVVDVWNRIELTILHIPSIHSQNTHTHAHWHACWVGLKLVYVCCKEQ